MLAGSELSTPATSILAIRVCLNCGQRNFPYKTRQMPEQFLRETLIHSELKTIKNIVVVISNFSSHSSTCHAESTNMKYVSH